VGWCSSWAAQFDQSILTRLRNATRTYLDIENDGDRVEVRIPKAGPAQRSPISPAIGRGYGVSIVAIFALALVPSGFFFDEGEVLVVDDALLA
jgi:hypothetical protein